MLCQLSYRGRQPADCTGAPAGSSDPPGEGGRPPEAKGPAHVSTRRLRRGAARRRPRRRSQRARRQRSHGRVAGRSPRAWLRSGADRRRPRPADYERARRVPARQRALAGRTGRPCDSACARSTWKALPRASGARGRGARVGRRRARVPASQARPEEDCDRRPLHSGDGSRATPLPAEPRPRA